MPVEKVKPMRKPEVESNELTTLRTLQRKPTSVRSQPNEKRRRSDSVNQPRKRAGAEARGFRGTIHARGTSEAQTRGSGGEALTPYSPRLENKKPAVLVRFLGPPIPMRGMRYDSSQTAPRGSLSALLGPSLCVGRCASSGFGIWACLVPWAF